MTKRSDASKKPSNRMNAVKPVDRVQSKPAAKPSGRVAAAQDDVKKSSRRLERPGVRPSGRLGRPAPSRARMNAAPAEAPEAVEEQELLDENQIEAAPEGDAPEAIAPDARRRGDSSRTMAAAGSRKSSRLMKPARGSSSAKSSRSEREDRNERGEKGRGGKGRSANNNNTMMIGLGVAGLVLLVIIIACSTGGKPNNTAKTKSAAPEVLTSAAEFAEKGRQLEAAGDRLGAADMFGRAADAAGSDDAAQKYNMHAYELRKFTTLNMSHGR